MVSYEWYYVRFGLIHLGSWSPWESDENSGNTKFCSPNQETTPQDIHILGACSCYKIRTQHPVQPFLSRAPPALQMLESQNATLSFPQGEGSEFELGASCQVHLHSVWKAEMCADCTCWKHCESWRLSVWLPCLSLALGVSHGWGWGNHSAGVDCSRCGTALEVATEEAVFWLWEGGCNFRMADYWSEKRQ